MEEDYNFCECGLDNFSCVCDMTLFDWWCWGRELDLRDKGLAWWSRIEWYLLWKWISKLAGKLKK